MQEVRAKNLKKMLKKLEIWNRFMRDCILELD